MKVAKIGKSFFVSFQYNGRRVIRKGGPGGTKKEAENALAAVRSDIMRDQYRFVSKRKRTILFGDYAERYLEEEKGNPDKRPGSLRRDETSLAKLKPFFGPISLANIRLGDIETFMKTRLKDDVKPATVNREAACLRHILYRAMNAGIIEKNPARNIRLFKEHDREYRILSHEEIKRLYAAAEPREKKQNSPFLREVLAIALNTGMRLGEILKLRWRDIDFEHRFIRVRITKSPEPRTIPMSSDAEETLKRRRAAADLAVKAGKPASEHVFPGRNDATRPVNTIANAYRSACERAGLAGLWFHDLRHTAATLMIEAGVDIATVKEILGHASITMTTRYLHPTAENKRRAVESLAAISRLARENAAEVSKTKDSEAERKRKEAIPSEVVNNSTYTN